MKTICPIMYLAAPAGYNHEISDCIGPKCQWWHKCRRPDQCPKCGSTGEPDDYAKGYECPNGCGWFDKAGDLIEYKEGDHEADQTVA
jgi:hypothetical protein